MEVNTMFKKRMTYFLIICFCDLISTAISFAGSKKVALSKKTVTMNVKGTYTIRLKGAKSQKVKWSSSNKKIAIVKKGVIKAKKKGKCIIWAKYVGKKYGCSVRVRDQKRSTSTPPLNVTPTPPIVSEPITTDKLQLVINGFSQDTKVISYSITNNSDETVNILTFVLIEKYDGQNWRSVPRKDSNVTAEAMVLSPHSKVDQETDLSTCFTDLSSGKYKLCIQTPYGKIGAEFTID